jgi:AraC family transcriptional regulator
MGFLGGAGGFKRTTQGTRTSMRERFDNYLEFYEKVYTGSLVERRTVAGAGSLHLSVQAAGEWSDAPIPELAIGMIVSGRGSYAADLGAGCYRSRIRAGEALVVAPNAGSYILRDGPHTVLFQAVAYRDLLALAGDDIALPPDGNFGRLHAGPLQDPLIPLLLERTWIAAQSPRPGDILFNQGALLTIAGILASGRDMPSKHARAGGLAPWKLKRVLDLLEAQLDGDVSLEQLAREVGMSPFHFARAFKRSTGSPPHRYLVRLKVERACRLLETTPLAIPDIALAVGYGDASYLARVFRRTLGVTPGEYRSRRRAGGSACGTRGLLA